MDRTCGQRGSFTEIRNNAGHLYLKEASVIRMRIAVAKDAFQTLSKSESWFSEIKQCTQSLKDVLRNK